MFLYQHPKGTLFPVTLPLPYSRSYSTEGNDYFFSGLVASSTNIWLMYLNNGQKNMAGISLFFLGYTVIDMIVHRGAYTHDLIIAVFLTVLVFRFWVKWLMVLKFFGMKVCIWGLGKMKVRGELGNLDESMEERKVRTKMTKGQRRCFFVLILLGLGWFEIYYFIYKD
jgi:hypothetical protein